MTKLEELDLEWIKLFNGLQTDSKIHGPVTAPFVSVKPFGYDPSVNPCILYVGKAEGGYGTEDRDKFLQCPTIDQLSNATTDFLEKVKAGKCHTPFWNFARRLSNSNLQNLVWTNVCKLSVIGNNGNPTGRLFEVQKDLAIKTLKAEIETYRPHLVIFITGRFAESLIRKVVGDDHDTSWTKKNEDLWWRKKTEELPAMMWTRHPQGARRVLLDQIAQVAKNILIGVQ
jgi:hypothetical protein